MKSLRSPVAFAPLLFAMAVGPASAFDCTKAESPVEKAICADAKLKAADDAMTAAYVALRNSVTGPDRKALGASQSKWVKSREDNCGAEEGTELNSCILSRTEERRGLLMAEPESGPGTGSRLMPVFIQQTGDPHHYDIDYTLVKFVKPQSKGESLLNKEADKIAKAAPLARQAQATSEDMTYIDFASMVVTYASPKFLSAKVDSYSFTGGAHGNGGTSGINIDLTQGRDAKSSDLFDSKGIAALKTDCVKQILEQKKDKLEGEEFDPTNDPLYSEQTVVEHLKSLDRWYFSKDKATLTFNAYAIGSYAEGDYECEFPMDKLKSLAKSGAALPE
jgi:uncharacterized protein YecT (DUF1311 family)